MLLNYTAGNFKNQRAAIKPVETMNNWGQSRTSMITSSMDACSLALKMEN